MKASRHFGFPASHPHRVRGSEWSAVLPSYGFCLAIQQPIISEEWVQGTVALFEGNI
jgi:hypothetical protein